MWRILAALLPAALVLAACGGGSAQGTGSGAQFALVLDSPPAGLHAGIYLARSRGYDEAAGVDLRIRRPGAGADPVALMEHGGADAAVMDIHDLGLALEAGHDLVGFMAVVQRPLPEIARRSTLPAIRRLPDRGAPPYPELVLVTTRSTLEDRRDDVRGLIEALQRGYGETIVDPESAVGAMVTAERVDRRAAAAQLDAVAPDLTAGATDYGRLSRPALDAWARWDLRHGVLHRPIDVGRGFDTTLVGASNR